MERDRGGHRGVKRPSRFGCESRYVSHPAFEHRGRGSVASGKRGADTTLSSIREKRVLARGERGGDEKERGGGGKRKSRKEGNTDKRLLKRNYAGRTRAKKKGATSRGKKYRRATCSCEKREVAGGNRPVIASAAARGGEGRGGQRDQPRNEIILGTGKQRGGRQKIRNTSRKYR